MVNDGGEILIAHNGSGDSVSMPMDLFDSIALMRSAQLAKQADSMPKGWLRDKERAACDLNTLGAEDLREWLSLPSLIPEVPR